MDGRSFHHSSNENVEERRPRTTTIVSPNPDRTDPLINQERTSPQKDLCVQVEISALNDVIKQQKMKIEDKDNRFQKLANLLKERNDECGKLKSQLEQLKVQEKGKKDVYTRPYDPFLHDISSKDHENRINLRIEDEEDVRLQLRIGNEGELTSIQCTETSNEKSEGPVIGWPLKRRVDRSPGIHNESFEVCEAQKLSSEEIKTLRENCERIQLEKADRTEVSECHKLVDALKAELAEVKTELFTLKNARSSLYSSLGASAEPQRDLEIMQKKIEQLTKHSKELKEANQRMAEKITTLKEENEALKRCLDGNETIVHQVLQLKKELKKEQEQGRINEVTLEQSRQANNDLTDRVQELERSLSEKAAELSQFSGNQVALENSALKHQIETFKEDFEQERRDRENLNTQKLLLENDYKTLRGDLETTRRQAREFEDELHNLRQDNINLRKKLEQVHYGTENASAASRYPAASASRYPSPGKPNQLSRVQELPMATNRYPATTPGDGEKWECKICTFLNQAPRSVCEICGTYDDERSRTQQLNQLSGSTRGRPGNQLQSAASGYQSGARINPKFQYGDIETDGWEQI